MPTSSQALILQTPTGDLPPLFQRRTWQPDQSFRHLPFTAASKTRRVIHVTDTRYTSVLFPLRRSGSEPNLARKNDFSTLQDLLQIKRLGALGPSNVYDSHYNKTDFDTISLRPRELAPIRRNKYVETQSHVDGEKIGERLFIPEFKKSPMGQRKYMIGDMNESTKGYKQAFPSAGEGRRKLPKVSMKDDRVTPAEFKKVIDVTDLSKGQERCDGHKVNGTRAKLGPLHDQDVHAPDSQSVHVSNDEIAQRTMELQPKNSENQSSCLPNNGNGAMHEAIYNERQTGFDRNVAANGEKLTTFMKNKMHCDIFELEASTVENADFFRLFETPALLNENVDGSIFRLETSTKEEPGSFQISPIENESVGSFRLIPPDAFELDDSYRLQAVPQHPNTFTLLQRDPYNNHVFKSVLTDWSISEMAGFNGTSLQHTSGKVARLRGNVGNCPLQRAMTVPGMGDRMLTELNDRNTENIAGTFVGVNSVKPLETGIARDIRRHQESNTFVMQRSPHHIEHTRSDTSERLNDQQTDEQREEYKRKQAFMGSIRNQSVDMYERLVNLGFRRAVEDPDKVSFYENIRIRAEKDRQKYFSSDWKTHNADQNTRAMESFGISGDTFSSLDSSNFMLNQCLLEQQHNDADSLANAAWKTKKIKALRMRKDPPPKDPNAVCIRLQDNAISHSELKRKIEVEVGVKVVSLQFDPVSVHCAEPEVKSQWIIRLPNRIICEYLTKCGLDLDGVHYSVKSFDEVMQREHNAYRLYAAYADMQARKVTNGEKRVKRTKRAGLSQTNTTGRLPQLKHVAVQ